MPDAHQSNGATGSRTGSGASVLLYHRVSPRTAPDPSGLTVTPDSFARQMAWLARRGFSAPSPSDWLGAVRASAVPRKSILITFDDAYADLATHALPVMKQHGFAALIFVVTGQIGGVNSWDDSTLPLMSADDIRRWSQQGFTFASHSHIHRDLRTLDAAALADDLQTSANVLRDLCSAAAPAFAYPYGHTNEAVTTAVSKHFQFAFTVEEGLNISSTDPHLLHRTMVLPKDTLTEFSLRARFGRNPLILARRALHHILTSSE